MLFNRPLEQCYIQFVGKKYINTFFTFFLRCLFSKKRFCPCYITKYVKEHQDPNTARKVKTNNLLILSVWNHRDPICEHRVNAFYSLTPNSSKLSTRFRITTLASRGNQFFSQWSACFRCRQKCSFWKRVDLNSDHLTRDTSLVKQTEIC